MRLRWGLHGDTLAVSEVSPGRWSSSRRIARQGEQLLRYDQLCKNGDAVVDTLLRVDASKPLPPPVMPTRALTINPADLVGTWLDASVNSLNFATTDTLTLRADSTWAYIRVFDGKPVDRERKTGKWQLYPGDVLWLGGWEAARIVLKDQQLVSEQPGCDRVYKRTSP
jgi:hypothetical protein